jgi:uncharacterized membrane protein YeaQ/YmgE (transglycosylase-associated protein family)
LVYMQLTPITIPQILAILFLAVVAALIAELIVGNAPYFGFIGAVVLALLGVWIFVSLPWLEITYEPRLEDIPVVRAVIGGVLVSGLFAFLRKKRSA